MNSLKPQFYSVQRIINSSTWFQTKYSSQIWQKLVQWSYYQFQLNRHITFGNAGNFGFKVIEETNKKVPYFFFNEIFAKSCKISVKSQTFVLRPLTKINYQTIAKNLNIKKIKADNVESYVTCLTNFLQQSLIDKNLSFIVIDFDVLGKIVKKQSQVWFQHYLPQKKTIFQSSSIRFHVEKEQNKVTLNKLNLLKTQSKFLPKISLKQDYNDQKQKQLEKSKNIKDKFTERQSTPLKDKTSRSFMKRKISLVKINSGQTQKEQVIESIGPKKRTFSLKDLTKTNFNSFYQAQKKQEQKNSGLEMMAAGPDPYKKSSEFSKLTNNLDSLMKTKFQFNKNSLKDNIPVIDLFSHTRASPVAGQRQNLLISGRLGCNYFLRSQKFQILSDSIKYTTLKSSILVFPLKEQLKGQDQIYKIVIKDKKTTEQVRILQRYKKSYEGFLRLLQIIPNDHIVNFRDLNYREILEPLRNLLQSDDSTFYSAIQEIQRNHLTAIKKSILNYILIDPIERARLSVQCQFNPVKIFGETKRKQISWQNFSFNKAKQIVQKNLGKNSKNILKIVSQWQKSYQNYNILSIPKNSIEYFTIDDFCDKQNIQINKYRNLIMEDWIKRLTQIYKDEVTQLKNDMEKCQMFFNSAGVLMEIKLRQLLFKSLYDYQQFFQTFNSKEINPPDTVLHLQKSLGVYQKSFIIVRVSHRRQEMYFMDNIDQIHNKLIEMVNILRETSQKIPRPQNFITKSHRHYFSSISNQEEEYMQILSSISEIIKKNVENCKKSLQIFDKYSYLLIEQRNVEDWIMDSNKHDRRQYSLTLAKYRKLYEEVMQQVPFAIRLNMICVDSSELKRFLLKTVQQIVMKLEQSVYSLVMGKNIQIQSALDHINIVGTSYIVSCENLVQVQQQMEKFRKQQIKQLQKYHADLMKWLMITLYNTFYPITADDLNQMYSTTKSLQNILVDLDKLYPHIEQQRRNFQDDLYHKKNQLSLKTKILIQQIQKIKEFHGTIFKDSALKLLQQSRTKITQYLQQKEQLNRKEILLGLDETQLVHLSQWDTNLKPFQEMWALFDQFSICYSSWTREDLLKQNAEFMQSECKNMLKKIAQLMKHPIILGIANSVKMCQNLADQVQRFMSNIPLVSIFSNKALRQRHFQNMISILNFQGSLQTFNTLNLHKIIGINAYQKIKELDQVNNEARKEYEVEMIVLKLEIQWPKMQIQCEKYKNSDIFIPTMESIESIKQFIDVNLMSILSVKGTQHAKVFQENLMYYENLLNRALQLIDFCERVRYQWIYYEPIMMSQDVLKQLPVEGSKFRQLNESWKKTCAFLTSQQKLSQIIKNNQVIKNLQSCQKHIQIVSKGIGMYLQQKRQKCTRFYFISDNQLMQMLRYKNDINSLGPFVKKCFMGIERLVITQDKYITGMQSSQGEIVSFATQINVALSRGNMDELFKQIESKMILAVRQGIEKSQKHLKSNTGLQVCLRQNMGSALIVGKLIQWTQAIEYGILNNGLDLFVQRTKKQIDCFFSFLNTQKLTLSQCITLQSLIICGINKIGVSKNLLNKGVTNRDCFEWQTHLRYYLTRQTKKQTNKSQQTLPKTVVKMMSSQFVYNHQYLGNQSILVITPMTDKCCQSLCTAIYNNQLPLIYGPSCIGKTSIIKDLSIALGYNLFYFNCSSQTNPKIFVQFIKGTISSGVWTCFDNLHLVYQNILSYAAQLLFELKVAKQDKQKMTMFIEDQQIKVKKQAQFIVTMNNLSEYRVKFPQNLKSLFRKFQMTSPDVQIIAQVRLLLMGFKLFQQLSKKIAGVIKYVMTLKQNKGQNFNEVSQMARLLKIIEKIKKTTNNDNKVEQQIIHKAFVLLYSSRLSIDEMQSLMKSLSTAFKLDFSQQQLKITAQTQTLHLQIQKQFQSLNLTVNKNKSLTQKVISIYQNIKYNNKPLIIVGQSYTGKSTSINVLTNCIIKSNAFKHIQLCKINPKAFTQQELFGSFHQNNSNSQWSEGLIPNKIKLFTSNIKDQLKLLQQKWLIFDGPLDSSWIQKLHSVLNDNKKLCLDNGQILTVQSNLQFIFQTQTIAKAPPSFINRCAIVSYTSQQVGYTALLKTYKKTISNLGNYINKIIDSFFQRVPQICTQIYESKLIPFVSQMNLTSTFLKIFTYYLKKIQNIIKLLAQQKLSQSQQKPENKNIIETVVTQNEKDLYHIIGSSFIFSVYNSFGLVLDSQNKKHFNTFLKRMVISHYSKTKNQKIELPQQGGIDQYCFVIDQKTLKINGDWKKWNDQSKVQQFPTNIPIHNIRVKTQLMIASNYLMSLFSQEKCSILISGSNGTGKKTILSNYFQQTFSKKQRGMFQILLSHGSKCKNIRNQIQNNLEKKGLKNKLAPKNMDSFIVKVDDINMPFAQSFNCQPPVQFFLQLLKQSGFYDIKAKQKPFVKFTGLQFLFVINLCNNSNNELSKRFLNRNAIIKFNEFGLEEMSDILLTILSHHFMGHPEHKNIKTILRHSMQIYQTCKQQFNLKKNEKITHTFNFNHIYQVLTSICMADKIKVHSQNIGRLWAHEAKRTFRDCLMPKQKIIFDDILDDLGKKWGKNTTETYFTEILSVFPDRNYEQVSDIEKINLSIMTYLNNYNLNSQKPLNLVLFKYFIEHVLIIYRVIKRPQGHALLIGNPGVGKKSISRLAAFSAGQEIFSMPKQKEYNYTVYRQLVRKMFIKAGTQSKEQCWIINDIKQFSYSEVIEDVNQILKLGIIKNLFSSQEKLKICQKIRQGSSKQDASQNNFKDSPLTFIYSQFENRVKNNLKMIICLDPNHKDFNEILKKYPSLLNKTKTDWMDQWPSQALVNISSKVLNVTELKHKQKYIKALEFFHKSAKQWNQKYFQHYKKTNYVTSSSFIDLMNVFKDILSKKRKQVRDVIMKFSKAITKLDETKSKTHKVEKKLQDIKPKLRDATQQIALKMAKINVYQSKSNAIVYNLLFEQQFLSQATAKVQQLRKKLEQSEQKSEMKSDTKISLKRQLQIAEQKVRQINKKLQPKKQQLQEQQKILTNLNYELQWAQKTKQKLQKDYELYNLTLIRGKTILEKVSLDKRKWQILIETYKQSQQNLDADVLLSSAQICFMGPFNQEYRQKIILQWKNYLQNSNFQITNNFTLKNFFISSLIVKQFHLNGLPQDNYFVQNAIILKNTKKWPLLIDPQQQGSRWLKNQYEFRKIKASAVNQDNLIRNLESSIQFGSSFFIEKFQEPFNPLLYAVLFKETFKKGSTTYIKLGQNSLIYSLDFSLFISTKVRNPQFSSEIYTNLSIIDFTLTQNALKQQILASMIENQKVELFEQMIESIRIEVENESQKFNIETKILEILTTSKCAILQDQSAYETILSLKQKQSEIEEKDEINQRNLSKIEENKSEYDESSEQATILYSCVNSLYKMNQMYQFSLSFIKKLITKFLEKKKDNYSELQQEFMQQAYQEISKSLHFKDRFILAALLAIKLSKTSNQQIQDLFQIENQKNTKQIFTNMIQNLLEKDFLTHNKNFNMNLNEIRQSTDPKTPILFILSTQSDPLQEVRILSHQSNTHLQIISLGLQTNQRLQRLIRQNIIRGGWVLLQNCHLALQWLSNNLLKTLQWMDSNQDKQIHINFRLWLTTKQSQKFPQQILLKSNKIVYKKEAKTIQYTEIQQDEKLKQQYSNQQFLQILFECLSFEKKIK